MGGKGSGKLNPRKATLPRRMRPGWLKRMDQRSLVARGLLMRLSEVTVQLTGDTDPNALSPIERSLAERWIHIEAMAMAMEIDLRAGTPIEVPSYLSAVDRLHSIGKTLGLKRKAKAVRSLAQLVSDPEDGSP
jgi:hypothetical protein